MGYYSAVAINASYIPDSAIRPLEALGFSHVNSHSGGSAVYTGDCFLLGTKSAIEPDEVLAKISAAIGDYHKGLTVSFYWEDSYDELTMYYMSCRDDKWQQIIVQHNKEEGG